MNKLLSILAWFLFHSLLVPAQGPSISIISDKNSILIGESFTLTLKADGPKGKFNQLQAVDSIGHFEILNITKDSITGDKRIIVQQKIRLTSWDSGKWMIPSLYFGKARSKPIFISVTFMPFNAQQNYHDIKEIIEVRRPAESKWWWYVLAFIFVGSLFLLFFPKAKKKDTQVFLSEQNAYKEAIRKIRQIKANAIKIEDRALYTEMIDIFRSYLVKRKNIQSYFKTSEDLITQLKALKLPDDVYIKLVETLRLSDLVKFAGLKPLAHQNNLALDNIEKTIMQMEQDHAV
ncbi:MAG: hypothetical protein NVS9B7_21010 [Flavisolibacter sp.]